MLKVHRYSSILKPSLFIGTMKQVMPLAPPSRPLVRANTKSCVATCRPVFQIFAPLMRQPSPSRTRARFHPGRVGAVIRLGQAEGDAHRAVEDSRNERLLLLLGAEVAEHQDRRQIADDRAFVLQIVVQAQPLGRQMLPDDRHREVGAVLAAVFLGQREAIVSGPVGAPAHLARAAPPIRGAAGRRARNRCAPIRGDGRRSGCCRFRVRAA